jgi:histone H3/H4
MPRSQSKSASSSSSSSSSETKKGSSSRKSSSGQKKQNQVEKRREKGAQIEKTISKKRSPSRLTVPTPAVVQEIYHPDKTRSHHPKKSSDDKSAAAPPSKKSTKASRRNSLYKKLNYDPYVYRVARQFIHKKGRIGLTFVSAVESILKHLFHAIASTASQLTVANKQQTLTSKSVMLAARVELSPSIATAANEFARKVAIAYQEDHSETPSQQKKESSNSSRSAVWNEKESHQTKKSKTSSPSSPVRGNTNDQTLLIAS